MLESLREQAISTISSLFAVRMIAQLIAKHIMRLIQQNCKT